MTSYELVIGVDEIPEIRRSGEFIARALTPRDGRCLVELLNDLSTSAQLRERLLSEVSDAIENCFDGAS